MILIGKHILIHRMISTSSNAIFIAIMSKASGRIPVGTSLSWCRYLSSYDFPTRTEEPIVTHTLAAEVSSSEKIYDNYCSSSTSSKQSIDSPMNNSTFVKEEERRIWLKNIMGNSKIPKSATSNDYGNSHIQLKCQHPNSSRVLSPTLSQPISSIVPKIVPPNLPRDVLIEPITHITTLSNGMRVSSQETYGQVCTLGLLSSCGSRYESPEEGTTGVNHLMEIMSFRGTTSLSYTDFSEKMDNLGGGTFASSSREHFLYCADVLRPNAREAMFLLGEAILNPRLDDIEVEESKKVIEWQWMDMIPEAKLGEGLQIAGFGPIKKEDKKYQQQLGMPHFCQLESLPTITSQVVRRFREEYLLNPEKMVIAGAGIDHDELVNLAEENFGHITRKDTNSSNKKSPSSYDRVSTDLNGIVPSIYTGGEHRVSTTSADGFMRIGLAFPTGGWFSSDLVPACVLQTLLGGGSSFSAGGPGKGMYSRLYREVLNRYYWVESAEAFTSMHTEAGLIGITGSSSPSKSRDLLRVFAEHFMRLVSDDVNFEELDRARNMLKCNVLTQLESRLVLFEDLGRQVLTYGMRERTQDMCRKIEEVTKEDIGRLARKAVLGNNSFNDFNGVKTQKIIPTVSAVGEDVNSVPNQEEVADWFKVIL